MVSIVKFGHGNANRKQKYSSIVSNNSQGQKDLLKFILIRSMGCVALIRWDVLGM